MREVKHSANGPQRQAAWTSVNWRKANRLVRNLRQRIFRATQEGDYQKVRSLQKLMLRSQANRLVSVRRVTQINRGKNTAGVDKILVKTPEARGRLIEELADYQPWKAKPARRVYIPKANGQPRPLGIPTILDRSVQAVVKNALEPCWEAKFETNSYGFRPGRGCHDAMQKIYNLACPNRKKKWVLDADIKGAFDNICHDYLLEALGQFPAKELIRQWLKAGYLDKGVFHETKTGTPQGSVISPLLLNVALHGMEEVLGIQYDKTGRSRNSRGFVRYADDLVVFCETEEDAQNSKQILNSWLNKRGLALSEEKTKSVHLKQGFDFLGFNVKHYPAPKTSKTGYKLFIKPSKKSVLKIRRKLKEVWQNAQSGHTEALLTQLNPIIRGWANYFRIGVAKQTFEALDDWMFKRAVRHTKRKHPHKTWKWRKARYWGQLNPQSQSKWVFGDKKTGRYVLKFARFPIKRHTLVKGKASPDDPSLKEYWKTRERRKIQQLAPREQKLALKQKGRCRGCGVTLFNDEELHIHHLKPKKLGGTDEQDNLEVVHLYCHQQIHASKPVKMVRSVPKLLLE